MVSSSIENINNSDLFKYSPYKSLTDEQKASLVELMHSLLEQSVDTCLVEGGAGTGKTILAVYLFSILHTDIEDLDMREFSEESAEFLDLVQQLKQRYPKPKTALVIPMSSFRETIKKVFRNVKNLRADMVIGPAEISRNTYDIVVVDESHRLRKRTNLGAYFGAFDSASKRLGLNPETNTELDWILKNSSKQIFFYDSEQSIKPSDVDAEQFSKLRKKQNTRNHTLHSQLRSQGGRDYVSYIDKLLNTKLKKSDMVFQSDAYEFFLFNSLEELIKQIRQRDEEWGLSRLVAGYAWKWKSKKSDVHDIEIEDIQLKWNGTYIDWVNSENALSEVGCIHTTQGYDLNYTGVIFGHEITYNPKTDTIETRGENYFDKNGKQSVRSPKELHTYIINIYKTLLLRGIKGTYVYVCDPELRKYLQTYIPTWKDEPELNTPSAEAIVSPYEEKISLPLYDSIGCGDAMYADPISHEDFEVPKSLVQSGAKYFVLRTSGDSMNQKEINDGDLILCQKNYQAPSGSIAVVQLGDDATLKEIRYESDGLLLIPHSTNSSHQPYKLVEGDDFKILGTLVTKLEKPSE